jgi:hypothetical protein
MARKDRGAEEQLVLFAAAMADLPIRPPFARRSDTSRAAAASVEACTGSLRAVVLGYIADNGSWGATCDEVEARSGLSHQTASARVNELRKLGAIVDSGRRRNTRSQRKATVWLARHAVPAGQCSTGEGDDDR